MEDSSIVKSDSAIIALLFARDEQALRELELKYGPLCRHLAGNILSNHQDVEECVNDAYLGVWNSIPPQRPQYLPGYLCRIVRNLALKICSRQSARKRGGNYQLALSEIAADLPASDNVESELAATELARELENFLTTLSRENRVIFLRRYWFGDSYQYIADTVGLSEKNISVRLTRIRRRLQQYLRQKEVL